MLSPSINVVDTLLTQAFNETLQIDAFAVTTGNLTIGKLPEDPDWLTALRSRVGLLAVAGSSWLADKPEIWGSVLLQFTNYASAFSGVATMQQDGSITTAQQWIDLLTSVLQPQLKDAIAATDTADQGLRAHLQAFQNVQPLLEESINEGWNELSSEESEMVAIATQLAHLQDTVASLEESITGTEIRNGQSIITTTVKTLYNVATEVGESFSFLSMATSAFTVGTTYYDIITNTAEIGRTLDQIADLQVKASNAAQAAAGTKMVLRLVYDLELTLSSIIDVMPQISTMWRNELQKLQSVVAALKAGVDPSSYLELVTVPTANVNWQSINSFALTIPTMKGQVGPPVTLDPQQPIQTQPQTRLSPVPSSEQR